MFQIVQADNGRFRVQDMETGKLTRGQFHRRDQAQDWIDQQNDAALGARVLRILLLRYNDPRRANQVTPWR